MNGLTDFFNFARKYSVDVFTVALLIALPMSIKFTNAAVIAIVVATLYSNPLSFIGQSIKRNLTGILISTSAFLFAAITITYSEEPRVGFYVLEKQLPLLLLPFALSVAQYRMNWNLVVRIFALVISAIAVICMSYGVYNYYTGNYDLSYVGGYFKQFNFEIYSLYGESLMRPFAINPIYMSMYVSFAIFIVLIDKGLSTFVKIILLLILLLFQALIGSRIGILAFGATFAVGVFVLFKSRGARLAAIGLIVLFAAVITVVIFVNPVLKLRYIKETSAFNIPADPNGWNSVSIRTAIWTCSLDLFKQHPLLGYSVGGQEAARDQCERRYSFYGVFGENLNCHNQYFEYLLGGGMILLLIFIGQLSWLFRHALRYEKQLYAIFIVLFAATCVGESLLETNKGVVFFAFFNSFFLFRSQSPSPEPNGISTI
jgi:O-antigen ligase